VRLLAVCESPPTLDPAAANGSTLIPAQVLPRLPADVEIDLVWFADRASAPPDDLLTRCGVQVALPLRPAAAALAAQPFTRLPRASWQRAGGGDVARRLAKRADVVYLHGLHVFPLGLGLLAPVLAHEVDPWSHFWTQRAAERRGHRAAYDRGQARRARRLERLLAARAARYLVVNRDDATLLSRELGRVVDAVPNGVDLGRFAPRAPGSEERDLLVFVGTLDYAPNVAAVRELVLQVLPLVRQRRPSVRLVVAGRRPVPAVSELAAPGVEVLGAVPDVREVYARAAVAVYPGRLGRGTKNTVLEALAVGCPVVASPEAARGLSRGEHTAVGATAAELAEHVLALLEDDDRRRQAGQVAARMAAAVPDWQRVAASYDELLRAAAAL
jgi:glycosyltransferase involved in cell wall biosynthesis